jgi:hypothetical protein
MMRIIKKIQSWSRRRHYREGRKVSRFIAKDVRREIIIISTSRIDEGILTVCVRTINVLYLARGFVELPKFDPPVDLHISELWHWRGRDWGGLANGKSICDTMNPPLDSKPLANEGISNGSVQNHE